MEELPHITADEVKSYRTAAKQVFGFKHVWMLSQTQKGVESGHSTAYVERHNLTIRMENRRYTRKTNAFSKMLSLHVTMMDLWAVDHTFCRIHSTLRTTPAVATGLADEPYDCEWIVELIDAMTPPPKKPGPPAVGSKYRPRRSKRRPPER